MPDHDYSEILSRFVDIMSPMLGDMTASLQPDPDMPGVLVFRFDIKGRRLAVKMDVVRLDAAKVPDQSAMFLVDAAKHFLERSGIGFAEGR